MDCHNASPLREDRLHKAAHFIAWASLKRLADVDSKQLASSSHRDGLNESTGSVASAWNDERSVGGKG